MTPSLVMILLCSAFTAADTSDALAAGNIAVMRLQQWVGTNDGGRAVLFSNENALGRACQVHRLQRSRKQEGYQHTALEAFCAKAASSCPRNSQVPTHDDKELLTRRSCSNRMQMQRTTRTSCPTRRSCGEKELRRELSPELFWGSAIFRAI